MTITPMTKQWTERVDENRENLQHYQNFTDTDFKKQRVPTDAWEKLYSYWQTYNHEREEEEFEGTIVNHWKVPVYMIDLNVQEESDTVESEIYDMVKQELEEWTGMEQRPVSLYGIHVYERGAILAPHTDDFPLVTSVIINVDQDVDEPWPLE